MVNVTAVLRQRVVRRAATGIATWNVMFGGTVDVGAPAFGFGGSSRSSGRPHPFTRIRSDHLTG